MSNLTYCTFSDKYSECDSMQIHRSRLIEGIDRKSMYSSPPLSSKNSHLHEYPKDNGHELYSYSNLTYEVFDQSTVYKKPLISCNFDVSVSFNL